MVKLIAVPPPPNTAPKPPPEVKRRCRSSASANRVGGRGQPSTGTSKTNKDDDDVPVAR